MFRRKLGTRIVLFFLVVGFLPLGIVAIFSFGRIRSSMEETINNNLKGLAARSSVEVGRLMSRGYFDIELLAENPIIRSEISSKAEILTEMRKVQDFYNIFEDITLIDPDGFVITSTTYDYRGEWEGKSFFQEAKKGKIIVSNAHIVLDPFKVVVIFTAPILGEDGKVKSVVAGQMNMEKVWEITDNFKIGRDGFLFIVNAIGDIIAHPDKDLIFEELAPEELKNEVLQDGVRIVDQLSLDGVRTIYGYSLLPDNPGFEKHRWRVIIAQPFLDAFSIFEFMSKQLVTIVLIAIVTIIFLSFLLTRYVVKPVYTLVHGAEQVAKGDLDWRLDIQRKDEIGQLGFAFNQMVSDLKEFHGKIRNYTQELELIVEERTAKLKNINKQLQAEITERVRAEERIKVSLVEKEVLLKEIHHRVKNNMQIISSLLRLQAGYIEDKTTLNILNTSQNQIRSMALIHEKLYQSEDLGQIRFDEYIRELTSHIVRSYGIDPEVIELKIQAHRILLDIDTAIPCGLIINELISNSLKHAFHPGDEGQICIDLHSLNQNGFQLTVSDNGVGFPRGLDFRDTQSLGLQLVNTLVEQLEGSIDLDNGKGTVFRIEFSESERKERS